MKILLSACLASLAPTAAGQDAPRQTPPTRLGTCVLQIDGLLEPSGAAFASDGTLYVSESLGRRVSVIDDQGKTTRTIGNEVLLDPRDVALGSDGAVFVSDAGLDAVLLFSTQGKLLRTIGKRGSKSGELNGPEGIAVFGDLLAVADALNARVQLFKNSGEFVRAIGPFATSEPHFHRPSDVAFAADGAIFVADVFQQIVERFSSSGESQLVFGTPGPNPGQFAAPTGLAVSGTFLHVVDRDNSRVQIFHTDGTLADWYGIHALRPREGQGKLHYPLRVALDAKGLRAAVVEPVENRVQILGELDLEVPELPPLPALPPSHFGGAVDADGPLFVLAEPSIPRILLFQMVDGEAIEITRFGSFGSGPGQINWPSDVAIDLARRRIFVADTGNARLSVFGFRFDPGEPHAFDPERARFIEQLDLARVPWAREGEAQIAIEPQGLWRDGEGGLCLADPRNRAVWRLDSELKSGERIALPPSCMEPIDGCAGARVDAANPASRREQYVVDRLGGSILSLGSGTAIATGLSRPSAVLLGQGGELYASDEGANEVLLLGKERKSIARGPGLGSKNVWRPRGLTELSGGRVLLIDWANHRGMIFDPSGKFLRAFGSQLFIRPTFGDSAPKSPEPKLTLAPAAASPSLPRLDGTRPWHSAKALASNGGSFAVFWKPTPDPIEERKTFALEVWVTPLTSPNTLAEGLTLVLDAGMPEHAHGINVVPQTTPLESGHFRVEGTRLHMPGRWEIYFDLQRDGRTERAQVTMELD